jgi:hypothetical protein
MRVVTRTVTWGVTTLPSERFTMGFERVQFGSKVIPTQVRIRRYKPLVENNGTK